MDRIGETLGSTLRKKTDVKTVDVLQTKAQTVGKVALKSFPEVTIRLTGMFSLVHCSLQHNFSTARLSFDVGTVILKQSDHSLIVLANDVQRDRISYACLGIRLSSVFQQDPT